MIAGYESKTCFTQYLWNLGLTNAHVFVYRRVSPEVPLKQWRGPCGVLVQEKLVLPNHGRELAAFHSCIVEHYDQPPRSVMFLHGHGPHAYHTDCQTILGRVRLYYRGLASPSASDGAVEFAQHMVSLTRVGNKDDHPWMLNFLERSVPRRLQVPPGEYSAWDAMLH